MASNVTPEMYRHAESMAVDLWKNIELLRNDDGYDELDAYLYNWAIYLGVLSLDVFESIIPVIRARRLRTASILNRCLGDYALRLRYYYIQSRKPLRGIRNNPDKVDEIKKTIFAIVDWDSASFSLGKKMSKYHESVWPDEVRDELEKLAADDKEPTSRSFSQMAMWLLKNEAEIRGVLPMLAEATELDYQNKLAELLGESNFVHGDQATISDVFEMDASQKPTGRIWRRSPADFSKTSLYTAINHVHHLTQSIGMIRGWSYNSRGSFIEAGRLWRTSRLDDLSETTEPQ